MFDDSKRIRNLLKKKEALKDYYGPLIREEKDEESKNSLEGNWGSDLWEIEEEITGIENNKLIRKARSLHIEIPHVADGNIWEPALAFGHNLTSNGKAYLSNEIRKIKKERQDTALRWGQLLTGLIGALTGLLAVFLTLRN